MTTSTDRIDQLALVWLVVPRKESRVSGFYPQLKAIAPGVDERNRLARECIARLQERGLVQPAKLLTLTEAGRRQALEALGVSRFPEGHKLDWAKKVLFLRRIGAEPTPAAVKTAGPSDALAARIVARRYGLGLKGSVSPSEVLAVLARRALGLEEGKKFGFDDAFSAVCLEGLTIAAPDGNGASHSQPPSSAVSLKLAERSLPEFASLVTDAARTSATGRWHGAVFISHVWNTLEARGDVGISFEKFKRRLIEAYQNDLVELSRADLVDAMPAADVSASETVHSGARFHFVRLDQLAS